MNILLTGIDGYIGWPTALKLSKEFKEAKIIGVDNLARRRWVQECGSVSAIPVSSMETRLEAAREHGFQNICFAEGDLADKLFIDQLISVFKPEVILHCAAQPSAPYSHINGHLANYTQFNNNQSTRNLLWSVKENNLIDKTHFIEMTTMGVYGAPEFEIPEGFIDVERKGKKDILPYPGMAGSWYHMSKSNDINNLVLANRMWGMSITDLRTAILYGTETEETVLDSRLSTRFDFDFYFGVVGNRFCAMALAGFPITIYGKGEQNKPQISLEDCVQSNVNAVRLEIDNKFNVYNQATATVSIKELSVAIKNAAEDCGIKTEIQHIENPRVEKEEHKMTISNEKFMSLLGPQKYDIESGMRQVIKSLVPFKETIKTYKDSFISV